MARKIRPVLQEVLAAIQGIEGAIAGKTFADFQNEWLLRHGVQRGIENRLRSESVHSALAPRAPPRNTVGASEGNRQRPAARVSQDFRQGHLDRCH
jgi:hypothetical protein